MRKAVDVRGLKRFMSELARAAKGPGVVYFTGGATALLLGIRDQTIDIDLKLDPEPAGVFEAIAHLKGELDLNIELAAPDEFIPPLSNWRQRSQHIATIGPIEFFHYDLRAQALAKLERGHDQDLRDVAALLERGLVEPEELRAGFAEIEPRLIRYPAIDPAQFRKRIEDFLASQEKHGE